MAKTSVPDESFVLTTTTTSLSVETTRALQKMDNHLSRVSATLIEYQHLLSVWIAHLEKALREEFVTYDTR